MTTPILFLCLVAAAHSSALYSVLGPSYLGHVEPAKSAYWTSSGGQGHQHTEVARDVLGGHLLRHSSSAAHSHPHSGRTDVQQDAHEFHINPFLGEASAHTSSAHGSLDPSLGEASFAQKTHQSKIAPGHSSVADEADTAAVKSDGSSAASRDVNAARTDVLHEGVAQSSHASHKSYAHVPGVAGKSAAYEANHRSFDGFDGRGNLHYDARSATQAQDALGHASADEAGYKLNHAYDKVLNLGATNELQYNRRAAHDPYGNYGAVTETREAAQGGQLVPVPVAYHEKAAVVSAPIIYEKPAIVPVNKVVYEEKAAVVPAPVVYHQKAAVVPAPVVYQEKAAVVPAPVVYQPKAAMVPGPITYQDKAIYEEPIVYHGKAGILKDPYSVPSYSPDYYY